MSLARALQIQREIDRVARGDQPQPGVIKCGPRTGPGKYSLRIDPKFKEPTPDQVEAAKNLIDSRAKQSGYPLDYLLNRSPSKSHSEKRVRVEWRKKVQIELWQLGFSRGEIAKLLSIPSTTEVGATINEWERAQRG